jgi:hypothetical protein
MSDMFVVFVMEDNGAGAIYNLQHQTPHIYMAGSGSRPLFIKCQVKRFKTGATMGCAVRR